MNDYGFTNKSGTQTLDFGDKVYVAQPDGTGKVYQFIGADNASVNLGTAEYVGDFGLWKELTEDNVVPTDLAKNLLKAAGLSTGKGIGIGGMVVRNDVRSTVQAAIEGGTATATAGNVDVTAATTAAIEATDDSVLFAQHTAGSGVIVTNLVQSGVDAHIKGAVVNNTTNTSTYPTLGDVIVSATNNSSIEATASTEVSIKDGSAYSFILAFNTVGYEAENLLFDTSSTPSSAQRTRQRLRRTDFSFDQRVDHQFRRGCHRQRRCDRLHRGFGQLRRWRCDQDPRLSERLRSPPSSARPACPPAALPR